MKKGKNKQMEETAEQYLISRIYELEEEVRRLKNERTAYLFLRLDYGKWQGEQEQRFKVRLKGEEMELIRVYEEEENGLSQEEN